MLESLDSLPLVLTVEEARKVLRISRGSAYEAVRTGAIPSIKVGRAIRIPRAALARLVEGHDGDHEPEEGEAA